MAIGLKVGRALHHHEGTFLIPHKKILQFSRATKAILLGRFKDLNVKRNVAKTAMSIITLFGIVVFENTNEERFKEVMREHYK